MIVFASQMTIAEQDRALVLFRSGLDTLQIAKRMKLLEAQVHGGIRRARDRELGKISNSSPPVIQKRDLRQLYSICLSSNNSKDDEI